MAKITEIRELMEFEEELDKIVEQLQKRHRDTKIERQAGLTIEGKKEIAEMIEKAHRSIKEKMNELKEKMKEKKDG